MATSWMLAIVSITPMANPDTAMETARRRTLSQRGIMANITEMMRVETNRAASALSNLYKRRETHYLQMKSQLESSCDFMMLTSAWKHQQQSCQPTGWTAGRRTPRWSDRGMSLSDIASPKLSVQGKRCRVRSWRKHSSRSACDGRSSWTPLGSARPQTSWGRQMSLSLGLSFKDVSLLSLAEQRMSCRVNWWRGASSNNSLV